MTLRLLTAGKFFLNIGICWFQARKNSDFAEAAESYFATICY